MRNEQLGEDFYLIHLEGTDGLLSLSENKKLSEEAYHSVNCTEMGEYSILVPVTKTTGNRHFDLGVFPEEYQTFQFQRVEYQKVNNFDLDGFWYDSSNGVIFYGWLYGIYAVKDQNDRYYDVITGDEIPFGMIQSSSVIETIEKLNDMIEDLELIQAHKDVYIQMKRQCFPKLEEGAKNRAQASKRYQKNYKEKKQQQDEKIRNEIQRVMKFMEQMKIETAPKREEIKQLIYQIRSMDEKGK